MSAIFVFLWHRRNRWRIDRLLAIFFTSQTSVRHSGRDDRCCSRVDTYPYKSRMGFTIAPHILLLYYDIYIYCDILFELELRIQLRICSLNSLWIIVMLKFKACVKIICVSGGGETQSCHYDITGVLWITGRIFLSGICHAHTLIMFYTYWA